MASPRRKRFMKLCMGRLGMDRNQAKKLAKAVIVHREESTVSFTIRGGPHRKCIDLQIEKEVQS